MLQIIGSNHFDASSDVHFMRKVFSRWIGPKLNTWRKRQRNGAHTPSSEPHYRKVTKATTSGTALQDVCSRVSFVVFDGEEKIETINQTSDDANFGIASFSLDEGEYRLVVIAHSGKGNCTMSVPEKVKFTSNKLTDTFYYYGRLSIKSDKVEADVKLQRAVAAFKLHITDETIPEEVRSIKFYYTGGSSTLDATTGYGCVNSRQTEIFNFTDNNRDFTVYTFPHEENKAIKMTISILDADAHAIKPLPSLI